MDWNCLQSPGTATWLIEDPQGHFFNDGVLVVLQFYRILFRWQRKTSAGVLIQETLLFLTSSVIPSHPLAHRVFLFLEAQS